MADDRYKVVATLDLVHPGATEDTRPLEIPEAIAKALTDADVATDKGQTLTITAVDVRACQRQP